MWPQEILALLLAIALPSAVLAEGVWLLITSRRRRLGASLVGIPAVYVAFGVVEGSHALPRWLYELDQAWVWQLHSQFGDGTMTILGFLGPAAVVSLAAVARRKGKRFAWLVAALGFTPTVFVLVTGLLCNDPQAGCGFTVAFALLGGMLVYAMAFAIALFRAIRSR
jgi:hypothetical protein